MARLRGGIKYRGNVNDPLTAGGRQAMDQVWRQLAGEVDYIITSPLNRCAAPARAWAAESGTSCIIEPRLAEIDYGVWEGKSTAVIQQKYPGMLIALLRNKPIAYTRTIDMPYASLHRINY